MLVLLVHDGRFDRTSWREQAPVIAEEGFRWDVLAAEPDEE